MVYRKGLGKGKGQGYKNILFLHDHQIHQRSGHGFKSPQKMPQLIKGTPVVSKFTKAKGTVVSTDPFAVKYKADSRDYVKLSNPKFWEKGGKFVSNPYRLPTVTYRGKIYFVDFKLGELRNVATAEPIKFTNLGGDAKDRIHSELRGLRSRYWANEYIAGVDDVKGEMQKGNTIKDFGGKYNGEKDAYFTIQSMTFDTPDLKKTMNAKQMRNFAKQLLKSNKSQGFDESINQKDLNDTLNAWVYLSNVGAGIHSNIKGVRQNKLILGGKDMPVTEIDEFEAKAEQRKKPSLFSKAKTAYSEYAQKKKEKRASEISQVRKEIRPELEKLNLQHKRVDTIKEHITSQEKKGMDTDKEIEELETEMEQLRELQEKATKINIQDLSNAELRLIAIKHKDDEGFLSGVFGSSNEYQDELIRRIHKEKAVDAEISKAKNTPVKKEESLFGDFF